MMNLFSQKTNAGFSQIQTPTSANAPCFNMDKIIDVLNMGNINSSTSRETSPLSLGGLDFVRIWQIRSAKRNMRLQFMKLTKPH